jgi:DNA-binding MarR family transcriptional regulator
LRFLGWKDPSRVGAPFGDDGADGLTAWHVRRKIRVRAFVQETCRLGTVEVVGGRRLDPGTASVELGLAVKRLRARLRAESTTDEGWTISQLSTLARIVREGPATASALAQVEHVRPQSVAEVVTALKAGGLVTAKPDPTDGRKVLLRATAAGRRLVETVSASREAWLARAIEAIVDEHRDAALVSTIELLNELAECDLDAETATGRRP